MTDPIADLLTRIRNAELARHTSTIIPHSKMKISILEVLKKYKYIKDFTEEKIDGRVYSNIRVNLKEDTDNKVYYKRISKPGQRIYKNSDELKPVKSGLGIAIISTSKGVMSNVAAKKLNIGGEILCEVW